ncbi:hypothetical protein WA171_002842 [Blastocystis sp. BT1]
MNVEDNCPRGREIAENIIKAAKQEHLSADELHSKDAPYYWEPEFPDDEVDKLSVFTVVGHNLHYIVMSTFNAFANIGYGILDFFGWSGSDYDWIQHGLNREERLESIIREEEEEENRLREERQQVKTSRQRNAAEMGEIRH